MPVLPIRRIGDPVLHFNCIDVRPNDLRYIQMMKYKKLFKKLHPKINFAAILPNQLRFYFAMHRHHDQKNKKRCVPPSNIITSVSEINEAMHATLNQFRKENGFGRAIAANQIGCPLNMIALNVPGIDIRTGQVSSNKPEGKSNNNNKKSKTPSRIIASSLPSSITLCNPQVTWVSNNHIREVWDDCFSFPDIMVRVRRFNNISVQFDPAPAPGQTLPASFLSTTTAKTGKGKAKSNGNKARCKKVVKYDESKIVEHILASSRDENESAPIFPTMKWECLDPNISELLQHETDHLMGMTSFDRFAIDSMRGAPDTKGDGKRSMHDISHPFVMHREEYLKQRDFYDSICKEWKY